MSGFITGTSNDFLNSSILQPKVSSPTQVSGLAFWVRADKGITISTGTSVSGWADQSGTGDSNKNLSQATMSLQPTLNISDSTYNHQSTLTFSHAASQVLGSSIWSTAVSHPLTAIVVGNYDGTTTSGFIGDEAVDAFEMLCINNGNDLYLYGGSFLTSTTVTTANPRILVGVLNATSSAIYISAKTAVKTGDTGAGGIGKLFVGQEGAGSYLNGKIAEILIYNRALAPTEIDNILIYCSARYGITLGA